MHFIIIYPFQLGSLGPSTANVKVVVNFPTHHLNSTLLYVYAIDYENFLNCAFNESSVDPDGVRVTPTDRYWIIWFVRLPRLFGRESEGLFESHMEKVLHGFECLIVTNEKQNWNKLTSAIEIKQTSAYNSKYIIL